MSARRRTSAAEAAARLRAATAGGPPVPSESDTATAGGDLVTESVGPLAVVDEGDGDKLFDNPYDNPYDKLNELQAGSLDDKHGEVGDSEVDRSPQVTRPDAGLTPHGSMQYPTGIEIPPDVHARVQRAAGARSSTRGVLRQTEILLRAFDELYQQIPTLVSQYKSRNQVSSPLFGTRALQVAETTTAMKRLQVRPTWDQYQVLRRLAADHGLPLAVLTRIVLRAYLRMDEPRRSRTRARS